MMNLDDYLINHCEKEPDYLAEINRDTHVRMINPRMCSGHLQGRVLSMLCKMIQPKYVLELGTYTGYSALCMAESLQQGGCVDTIECDDELEEFILENIKKSPYSDRINLLIGNALDIIPNLEKMYDLVFIDADKREYTQYYETILPKLKNGGFIFADNTLWDGKILEKIHPNDKQTIEIMSFNDYVVRDERVEKIMIPIRDGLTIIRKKPMAVSQ